jgi:glycerol-3-phosphate O-acyltransferase/dihydroxyacetone phosphate acyltransferase
MFNFFRSNSGIAADDAPHPATTLFPKTDPAVDGEECLHDCDSCTVRYPKGFKIEQSDDMYGKINAWATHLVVGTSKTDWKRDVADEEGSVMEAVDKAKGPSNGVSFFHFPLMR